MTTAVISDFLESTLINHVLRNTAYTEPASVYIALFTDASAQNDANGGTEVSGGSYARVEMTAGFDAPSNGATANTGAITFPTATAAWGNIRYIGIFNASTSGSLLFWGQLTADKDVGNGDTFSIAAGDLDVSLGGAFSYYLANELLDMVLNSANWPTPGTGVYAALYTAAPTASGGGTEVSGGSYARTMISGSSWLAPTATTGSTVNAAVVTFPAASASWGEVVSVGLLSASTSGNLFLFGNLTTPRTVGSGDTFRFSAQTFGVTIS